MTNDAKAIGKMGRRSAIHWCSTTYWFIPESSIPIAGDRNEIIKVDESNQALHVYLDNTNFVLDGRYGSLDDIIEVIDLGPRGQQHNSSRRILRSARRHA